MRLLKEKSPESESGPALRETARQAWPGLCVRSGSFHLGSSQFLGLEWLAHHAYTVAMSWYGPGNRHQSVRLTARAAVGGTADSLAIAAKIRVREVDEHQASP